VQKIKVRPTHIFTPISFRRGAIFLREAVDNMRRI